MVSAKHQKELPNVLPNGNPFASHMLYDVRRDGIHPVRHFVLLPCPVTTGKGLGIGVLLGTKSFFAIAEIAAEFADGQSDTDDIDDISDINFTSESEESDEFSESKWCFRGEIVNMIFAVFAVFANQLNQKGAPTRSFPYFL